ncbi:MAG: hypothetical protein ACTHMR_17765 [Thermomicrobiales bacterium]
MSERKQHLQDIYNEIHRAIEARVGRFLIGDRFNLAAPTVGVLPPSAGGSGTNSGAEPALGNPATTGDLLSSTTAGVRAWVAPYSLTVDESDGAPSVAGVTHLTVSNSTLTDNGSGHVTITTGGGGGSLTVDEVDGTPSVAGVSHLTLPNGTLTDNGSGHVTYTPAGGGSTIGSGTLASRPAAATAGNLYLPTDAPFVYRDTGTTWESWGPLRQLTPPSAGSYTWVNQGSATTDTSHGTLILSAPAVAGDQIRALVKSVPAAPYTVTIAIIPAVPGLNYAQCGLVLRESSSGKLALLNYCCDTTQNTGYRVQTQKFTNPTTFSASSITLPAPTGHPLWLRLQDDNTNRIASVSLDGVNFWQIHSVGRTDFLTPDQIGLYVNTNQGTYPTAMNVLHWAQS